MLHAQIDLLRRELVSVKEALIGEKVASAALSTSLQHADSERAFAIHAATNLAQQVDHALARLKASQSEAQSASEKVAAAGERAEAFRLQVQQWEARTRALDAWREAVTRKADQREQELVALLDQRDRAARAAVADSVMRRRDCLVLSDEMRMIEAELRSSRSDRQAEMRKKEAEDKAQDELRSSHLASQEYELKRQLALLSQHLQDDDAGSA